MIPRVELLHLLNLSHNILNNRTRKKVGLIFASNFDRCKVNLLVYVKLWKQACVCHHYCLRRSFGRLLLLSIAEA